MIFTNYLRTIKTDLAERSILGLDVNAYSVKWHCKDTNRNRIIVEEMLDEMELTVMNIPGQPWTFQGARGNSNIDVTLATRAIAHKIDNWTSTIKVTSSDHTVIAFVQRENV